MVYSLFEFIVTFIECIMSFVFCGIFFKNSDFEENNYLPVILSISISALLTFLANFEVFSSFNTAIGFLAILLCQFFLHKSNIIKTFCVVVSYYALVFIIDMLSCAGVAATLDLSISYIFNNFSIARIVGTCSSKAILIIICIMIKKILSKLEYYNKKIIVLLSVFSVIIIVVSAEMYVSLADSGSKKLNFILAFFFCVMLALVMTIYLTVILFFEYQKNKQESELTEQRNIILEKSLAELESTFSMWRNSVHDYKNTVLAIKSMLSDNKTSELEQYIDSQIKSFENRGEYIRTGNRVVDAVINAKLITAEKNKINFTVNAKMPEKICVSDIQLATIVGNLLDNALECEDKEKNPYIHIQISVVKSFLLIKVVNKCTNNVSFNKTSKTEKEFHGIGLKNVRDIVRQHNGDFSMDIQNNEVSAVVILPI